MSWRVRCSKIRRWATPVQWPAQGCTTFATTLTLSIKMSFIPPDSPSIRVKSNQMYAKNYCYFTALATTIAAARATVTFVDEHRQLQVTNLFISVFILEVIYTFDGLGKWRHLNLALRVWVKAFRRWSIKRWISEKWKLDSVNR